MSLPTIVEIIMIFASVIGAAKVEWFVFDWNEFAIDHVSFR